MTKKTFLLLFTWLTAVTLYAQQDKSPKYSTYYYQRASLFESLPVTSEDIIFIGNSITDGGEWHELFNNPHVKNRGISGDTTQGVFDRLDAIVNGQPAKIFLMIGINNVPQNEPADTIAAGIRLIVQKIKQVSPETQIYVQSLLPVTTYYNKFYEHTCHWKQKKNKCNTSICSHTSSMPKDRCKNNTPTMDSICWAKAICYGKKSSPPIYNRNKLTL